MLEMIVGFPWEFLAVIWATLPDESVAITPEGSPLTKAVTYSPDCNPDIDPCRPFCPYFDSPSDVALDTVSQYTTFPVEGIMIIRPGGPVAAVDKNIPRGACLVEPLQDSGNGRVNTSAGESDDVDIEYGQTNACD